MVIPVSGVNNWLTINGLAVSFETGNENSHLNLVEERRHEIRLTKAAPINTEVTIVDSENDLDNPSYNIWFWKPDKFSGLYELQVSAPDFPIATAQVRIYPRKVSYDEYRKMLEDIAAISYDLLFRVGSPASEKAVAQKAEEQSSALRHYELLKTIVDKMDGVMAQIRRNPYKVLGTKNGEKLLQRVGNFSGETRPQRGEYVKLPKYAVAKCHQEQLPRFWSVPQQELTTDVYENRLLKNFLAHQLVPLFNSIHASAERELFRLNNEYNIFHQRGWDTNELELQIRKIKEIMPKCETFKQRCLSWAGESFLYNVKSNVSIIKATQVLLKNFVYSQFFQLYLQLRYELKIKLDTQQFLTDLSLRKMADIYEMWAIFYTAHVILDVLVNAGFTLSLNSFFTEQEEGRFQVDVVRNRSSIILVKNDLRVELKYEPKYVRLNRIPGLGIDSGTYLTPDFALEIWRGQEVDSVIIFDPKYRIQKQNGINSYPYDAYGKMADYRQRICYLPNNFRDPRQDLQEVVNSAYILYPGDELRHNPRRPELGAIPVRPNMSKSEKDTFQAVIKDILTYSNL